MTVLTEQLPVRKLTWLPEHETLHETAYYGTRVSSLLKAYCCAAVKMLAATLLLTAIQFTQADWVQLPILAREVSQPANDNNTLFNDYVKSWEPDEKLTSTHEPLSPTDFLRSVEKSLFQNGSPRLLTNKLQLLDDLRVSLLSSAEDRLLRLWNPDGRQGRHDKGMGFPSQEGALMTIAFLLFAVYLVKLVQQLIQSLQATTPATTMMIAGTGRKRRQISDALVSAEVLNLIHQYEFQIHQHPST